MSDTDSSDQDHPPQRKLSDPTKMPWQITSASYEHHIPNPDTRLPLLDWHDLLEEEETDMTDIQGNYSCCNVVLKDMHELVQHFEGHVGNLGELAEVATAKGMTVGEMGRRLAKRSGTGDSDGLPESKPDYIQPSQVISTDYPRDFLEVHSRATSVQTSHSSHSSPGSIVPPSPFRVGLLPTPVIVPSGVAPSMVMGGHSGPSSGNNTPNLGALSINQDPGELNLEDVKRSASNLEVHGASPEASSISSRNSRSSLSPGLEEDEFEQGLETAEALEEPETNQKTVWICPEPSCGKRYKNAGGLKYHRAQAHPNSIPKIPEGLLGRNGKRGKNVPDIYKPYKCPVINCGKRYKNLNGLKYHIEHHHFDVKDDPTMFTVPRVERDGQLRWDLSSCYDPLPQDAENQALQKRHSTKKRISPQPSPHHVLPPNINTNVVNPSNPPSSAFSTLSSGLASAIHNLGLGSPAFSSPLLNNFEASSPLSSSVPLFSQSNITQAALAQATLNQALSQMQSLVGTPTLSSSLPSSSSNMSLGNFTMSSNPSLPINTSPGMSLPLTAQQLQEVMGQRNPQYVVANVDGRPVLVTSATMEYENVSK